MKKWKSLCLCFGVLLCLLPFVAPKAHAATDGYYTYSVSGGKARITDVNTDISGNITIPSTLGGCPVTAIGIGAFANCAGITGITIPESVTSIDYNAFYGCTGLNDLYITDPNAWCKITFGYSYDSDYDEYYAFGNPAYYAKRTHILDSNGNEVTNLVLDSSVTFVPMYAFANCTALTSVTIGNTALTVDWNAFAGCSNLESLTLPIVGSSGNQYPLGRLFGTASYSGGIATKQAYCTYDSLGRIYSDSDTYYIPESLKTVTVTGANISCGMFQNCSGLTSIVIPETASVTGCHVFDGCTARQISTYADGTYYGRGTNPYYYFAETISNSVTSVEFHPNTKYICGGAFQNCTGLEYIVIPEDVEFIGEYAFSGCSNLVSVKMPSGVSTIERYTFANCTSLTNIDIPSGVYVIYNSAFRNCSKLAAITIPTSTVSVGNYAFNACTRLKTVYYAGNQTQWKSISVGSSNTPLTAATKNYSHIHNYTAFEPQVLAPTCTEGGYTVYTCIYGETVTADYTLPLGHAGDILSTVAPNCTDQGYDIVQCNRCGEQSQNNYLPALGHDHSIPGSTVAPTCTQQGYTALGCSRCGDEAQTNTVAALGHDYSGETVTVTAPTCTETGLQGKQCIRCDAVDANTELPATGHTPVLEDIREATCTEKGIEKAGAKCHVCGIYFLEPQWTPALGHSFTNYISNNDATAATDGTKTAKCDRCEATDTVVDEGSKLSGKCGDNLTWSIADDGTLTISGTGAMYDYSYDTATTETDIPWYTYRKEITAISIGSGVTKIGKWAFRDCSNVTALVIPHGVKEIGGYAFWICTGLETVEIPETVKTIDAYAFYKCSSLSSVTIPEGVTNLPTQAFYQCTKLTTVTLPLSVTEIGNSTFRGCSGLKDVYYAGTLEQWNTITVGTNNTPLTKATLHYHVHSFTNYISNNDATWEQDGTKTAKCDACDATDTITDPGTKLPLIEGTIIAHPRPVTADSGNYVEFKVTGCGEIISYKWQYRKVYKWFDTTMEGYNTDTLTVTAAGSRNGYDYRCVITFADGTVAYSNAAKLTVNTTIDIAKNPSDQTVVLSYKGQFTVTAEGESLKYQWEYKRPDGERWIETAMEGATKPTVYIESTTARDGYQYRCKITDAAGKIVYTEPATMRVLSFKSHPETVFSGPNMEVTFHVETSVDTGFTYQWQYSANGGEKWSNTTMTGYNTDTLTVKTTLARQGYLYRCVLTGSKNSKIESKTATLYVANPVAITSQPVSVSVSASANAVFAVSASNVYSYQWYYSKNGTNWYATTATGNKTATLTVAAKGKNGYMYRCKLIGYNGSETYTKIATITLK